MPHKSLRVGTLAIAVVVAVLCLPGVVSAHEHRTIAAGKYDVVVGWDTEPPYVNVHNGAGIRISRAGTNPAQPVLGAEQTLKVQIRQGAESRTFPLRPVTAQPGYYVSDIVPTRPGDYIWRFSGTVGTDQIDETFDTSDGKFDAVASGTSVEFPVAAPDPDQVNQQLQAADASIQRAQLVAYIGAGLGVLGVLVALLAWLTRPRAGVLSSRDAAVRRLPRAG